jgi:hypothetical protein
VPKDSRGTWHNVIFSRRKKMKQKIAVILAGCGVYDGAEINEVVLTLLELEKH